MAKVIYKPIPGFPGYLAGDNGTVWSKLYPKHSKVKKWRRLNPALNKDGYPRLIVYRDDGFRWHVTLQVLILKVFVGDPST